MCVCVCVCVCVFVCLHMCFPQPLSQRGLIKHSKELIPLRMTEFVKQVNPAKYLCVYTHNSNKYCEADCITFFRHVVHTCALSLSIAHFINHNLYNHRMSENDFIKGQSPIPRGSGDACWTEVPNSSFYIKDKRRKSLAFFYLDRSILKMQNVYMKKN